LLNNNFKNHSGNAINNPAINENTQTINILDSQISIITHHLHLMKEEVRLSRYNLEKQVASYKLKEQEENTQLVPNLGVSWTGSKAALVELIYALCEEGVFNNGNTDLKQLVNHFQTMFNINLGEYYRAFHEIKSRKKEQTKFLDALKEKLLKRINEID
jgi:hypothetical protein